MDLLRSSEKTIRGCYRTEEEVTFTKTQNTRRIENTVQNKINILEFYIGELNSKKEKLANDIEIIKSIIIRVEQTLKSLQYPKDTNLKCCEIRGSVLELQDDIVQKELYKEIKLIEDTRLFMGNLLEELRDQLRKHRSSVFYVETDLKQKTTTLNAEKQNNSIKETDLRITPLEKKNTFLIDELQLDEVVTGLTRIKENWQNVDWINSTQKLLDQVVRELENAQKLICLAEESLSSKTSALITQYNCCNESFYKRVAHFQCIKSDLESELLRVNELIHRVGKCINDSENAITANKMEERVLKMRLKERISSNNAELLKDMVQVTLVENLQKQCQAVQALKTKFTLAQSSFTSLTKMKNKLEVEIKSKIIAIKVDEVECLPARSSIHYHVY